MAYGATTPAFVIESIELQSILSRRTPHVMQRERKVRANAQ